MDIPNRDAVLGPDDHFRGKVEMKTQMPGIQKKKIALVAHDSCKKDMLEWVKFNVGTLQKHELFTTGTTGKIVAEETGLAVTCFRSGPLGGDMQLGVAISEGQLDVLIFFWDPMTPLPHDVDVRALLRMAVLYNIPTACNRATADFLISSPLLKEEYKRSVPLR